MKNRKRYTVQYKPTGAGKAMMRGMGVFHAVFGTVFALIALTVIIPSAGLIGILFLAAGVFFAVNGALIALGKNGLMGRAYQIETEEEISEMPAVETHDHIPSTALDAKRRMEQLESLKTAGLITEQEYQQKRQEILKEL
ncbi:SHOCT domain-containing protein [Flintibacter muris]|uniref:SHOCT domain-containing protein n=1 Tax=Flintibacter muris TaxID=2941327 RepID=UPI0020425130|nr:SHOCT domain-containing protein [Flintibacter muris]